jgi:hypothetical protein
MPQFSIETRPRGKYFFAHIEMLSIFILVTILANFREIHSTASARPKVAKTSKIKTQIAIAHSKIYFELLRRPADTLVATSRRETVGGDLERGFFFLRSCSFSSAFASGWQSSSKSRSYNRESIPRCQLGRMKKDNLLFHQSAPSQCEDT